MEIWKSIPSTLGFYEASSLGRIRRIVPAKGTSPGKIIKAHKHANGYMQIGLTINKIHKTYMVARLVCEAFNGPSPIGYDVNHKDFDPTNNTPDNLEWLSRKGNILYTIKANRRKSVLSNEHKESISIAQKNRYKKSPNSFCRGEEHWAAKFTDEQMIQAFNLKQSDPNLTIADVARQLSLPYQITYDVLSGRKRKYLNLGSAIAATDITERSEDLIL